jgi:carbon monoxide dehydrogenase subunit G
MKVNIAIQRSLDIDVVPAKVKTLFKDLETTIGRFPKLRTLKKLGPDQYLWEMNPIGSKIANIAHEVRYGAHYTVDAKAGTLSWKPIAKQGNASIEGGFRVVESGSGSRLEFTVKGELFDVPVPLMYRLVAPAFIQAKFAALVDAFLERTRDALKA